jgi:hypothetical protein
MNSATPSMTSTGLFGGPAHVFENQRWVAGVWSKPLALLDVDPYEFVDEGGNPAQGLDGCSPLSPAWSVRVALCA